MNPLDRTLALGPLALSLGQLLLIVAMIVALAAGAWLGRRHQVSVGDALFNALFIGVLVARITFVAVYGDGYDTLWSWFDLRDRGFQPLAGLGGAVAYLGWRCWRHPLERRPLGVAIVSGGLAWSLSAGALALMAPRGGTLPEIPVTQLDGTPLTLPTLLQEADRPMVINLWASWCPPCRREMPMLAKAQQQIDDVTFVFLNQGEGIDAITAFLEHESLTLEHLYRDPKMAFGREVGAMALPTTLYYDAEGRLIDSHFGALSRATLTQSLERLR